ncbi:hypothetical protein D9M70_629430 [compost metagenome]
MQGETPSITATYHGRRRLAITTGRPRASSAEESDFHSSSVNRSGKVGPSGSTNKVGSEVMAWVRRASSSGPASTNSVAAASISGPKRSMVRTWRRSAK